MFGRKEKICVIMRLRLCLGLFLCSKCATYSIEEIRQTCVSSRLPSLTGLRIIKTTTRDAGPARKLTSADCPQCFLWGPEAAELTESSSSTSVPFMRAPWLPHSPSPPCRACCTGPLKQYKTWLNPNEPPLTLTTKSRSTHCVLGFTV